MRVLAVLGNKGGSGKSSLAVSLAALVADKGGAVVVDLDPNAGATHWLLAEAKPPTTVDADLAKRRPMQTVDVPRIPGLSVAPGDLELAERDSDFRNTPDALAAILKGRKGESWCVVDCPPSWGALQASALFVANVAVLVCDCTSSLGLAGVADQLDVVQAVRKQRKGLHFAGLVPNKVSRTRASRAAEGELRERYRQVLHSVRQAAAPMAAAVEKGQTVWQMPAHPVQEDLRKVWASIVRG